VKEHAQNGRLEVLFGEQVRDHFISLVNAEVVALVLEREVIARKEKVSHEYGQQHQA
jgi:hypothetical protein